MKVLLADTDIATRTQIESLLEEIGLTVSLAVDGRHAWELLGQQSVPVLAILDAEVPPPAMNGLEICRRLRRDELYHYCYIILLSSQGHKLATMTALENGADDFLSKPLDKDEFISRVLIGKRILAREEKLTQITIEWRNMLDRCPMGSVLIDSDWTIKRANKIFYERLGYNRPDLLYKDLRRTVIRDPDHLRHIQDHGQNDSPFSGAVLEYTCKNGETLPLITCGWPHTSLTGQEMVLFMEFPEDGE